jgi:hypothetical protein
MLMLLHCNNICTKSSVWCVTLTFSVLFMTVIRTTWTYCAKTTKSFILKHLTHIAVYGQSKLSYIKEKLHILIKFVFITDVPRYRAFAPVFIYSVCLYVLTNIMSFLNAREVFLHIFKKDDSTSGTVFNVLLIITLVNCTSVPVLSWIDTPKFVQYLHKWEEFQVGNNWQFLEFSVNCK